MRIAVKVTSRRVLVLDAAEVYYLESDGHDTWIRTARKARLRSLRRLGDFEKLLAPAGFLRIQKSLVVNLDRIREIRVREGDDNDREVKLDPPVNAVLPVGRVYLAALRRALRF